MKWTLVDKENVKNPVTYDFIGLADIWALKLYQTLCISKVYESSLATQKNYTSPKTSSPIYYNYTRTSISQISFISAKCIRKKCLTQSMYILMIAKRNWEQYGMVKFSFIYNDILTH